MKDLYISSSSGNYSDLPQTCQDIFDSNSDFLCLIQIFLSWNSIQFMEFLLRVFFLRCDKYPLLWLFKSNWVTSIMRSIGNVNR